MWRALLVGVCVVGCKGSSKKAPGSGESARDTYGIRALRAVDERRAVLLIAKDDAHQLVALVDAAGAVTWKTALPDGEAGGAETGITVDGTVVTVKHTTGPDQYGGPVSVSGFALDDGRLLWTTAVTGPRKQGMDTYLPAIGDAETVIAIENADHQAHLTAVTRASGAIRWQRSMKGYVELVRVLPTHVVLRVSGEDDFVVVRRADGVETRHLPRAQSCFAGTHAFELIEDTVGQLVQRDLDDPAKDETLTVTVPVPENANPMAINVEGCGVRGDEAVFVVSWPKHPDATADPHDTLVRVDLTTRAVTGAIDLPFWAMFLDLDAAPSLYRTGDDAGRIPRVVVYPIDMMRKGYALVDLDDRRSLRTVTMADRYATIVGDGSAYVVSDGDRRGYVDDRGVMRGAVTVPESAWAVAAGTTLWIATRFDLAPVDRLTWTALDVTTFQPRGSHALTVAPAPDLVDEWN